MAAEIRYEYTTDELARLVHPRDGHPKVLTMIEAYLDESGIHKGAAYCVIAGYYGGRGQWRRFEHDWRRALTDHDVPLEKFHALDLLKRHKYFFGWSDAQQSGLLASLSNAITKYKIHPVSFALVVEDFKSFSLLQRRFFTGAEMRNGKLVTSGCPNRPYFAPFMRCMKHVASYAPAGGKAHFFFGLDRPFAKYAQALYKLIAEKPFDIRNRERLGDIAFPLAKQTPHLQAADLLAFLTVEHMKEIGPHGYAHPKSWLKEVLARTQMQDDHVLLDKAHFQETLKMSYMLAEAWDGPEDEKELPEDAEDASK